MTTERKMSFSGFLKKATSAKSALGFLSAHRNYMLTGELSPVLSPIVALIDDGTLMPTPAVEQIAQAVLSHIVASDQAALEARIQKSAGKVALAALPKPEVEKEEKALAPWIVSVYDSTGQICTRVKNNGDVEDLVKGFNDSSSADRWAIRRLLEQASDSVAHVDHSYLPIHTIMTRNTAMSIALKQPKSAVTRPQSKGSQKLSFGCKVKESRSVFSGG